MYKRQGLGHAVEGHAGLRRAHSAHHVQVNELLQLLPVGGGAEHQDLLVHKAGLPQCPGLGHLGYREAADALVPKKLGQGRDAGAPSVPGQHAVDHRPGGPLLDHRQIVLDRRLFDD